MSDEIRQYDDVQLKDGRIGGVVEVYGDQELFEIDVGFSPKDWKTISVKRDQIEKVVS